MIMYKICLKISEIVMSGIVICFIILPYLWSAVFRMNYLSMAIEIPATHETIYLISHQARITGELRTEISKCGWRIYNSSKKEYSREYVNDQISPLYYKVSKDTLYIVSWYSLDPPSENTMRTKIIQINLNDYVIKDDPDWWERSNLYSKEERMYFEEEGFSRFP